MTEQSIITNGAGEGDAEAKPKYESLPSFFRAIEVRIQPNYTRLDDDLVYGYYWISRWRKTGLSARVYPNRQKETITVAVFDDTVNHTGTCKDGEPIRMWSGDIRMTGNWRRRLSRAAGEAIVLMRMRPKCPLCGRPLVLRERKDHSSQFFGCPRFPDCHGSVGIVEFDLDRNEADYSKAPYGRTKAPQATAVA
jgi:hypothetical protein